MNQPTSDTLLASGPPGPSPSVNPPSKPSRPPTSPPRSGPSSKPTSNRAAPAPVEDGKAMWIALWILAAIVSIGSGVYFALR